MGTAVSIMFFEASGRMLGECAAGFVPVGADEDPMVRANVRLTYLVLAMAADAATTFLMNKPPEDGERVDGENFWGSVEVNLVNGEAAKGVLRKVARERLLTPEVERMHVVVGDKIAEAHAGTEGGVPLRAVAYLVAREAVRATLRYAAGEIESLCDIINCPDVGVYPAESSKHSERCELFKRLVPYMANSRTATKAPPEKKQAPKGLLASLKEAAGAPSA